MASTSKPLCELPPGYPLMALPPPPAPVVCSRACRRWLSVSAASRSAKPSTCGEHGQAERSQPPLSTCADTPPCRAVGCNGFEHRWPRASTPALAASPQLACVKSSLPASKARRENSPASAGRSPRACPDRAMLQGSELLATATPPRPTGQLLSSLNHGLCYVHKTIGSVAVQPIRCFHSCSLPAHLQRI